MWHSEDDVAGRLLRDHDNGEGRDEQRACSDDGRRRRRLCTKRTVGREADGDADIDDDLILSEIGDGEAGPDTGQVGRR
jgi:hypothetical protein